MWLKNHTINHNDNDNYYNNSYNNIHHWAPYYGSQQLQQQQQQLLHMAGVICNWWSWFQHLPCMHLQVWFLIKTRAL